MTEQPNSPLLIDNFEPTEIERLLSQTATTIRTPLNQRGIADYYWCCYDGHATQLERKQWNELLAEFDEIEEQLRRYIDNTTEMGLIVEGVLAPHSLGCETWKVEPNSYVSRKQIFKRRYTEVLAWLWSLDKQGVTVYQTPHYVATAYAISAFYHNSQKSEHTTLRRYIKVKPASWIPNPHIQNLINLRHPDLRLGEEKATALVERFGSYWGVITRTEEELCEVEGIGPATAKAILRATGRIP